MNIIQTLDDAEGHRTIAIIGSLSATTTREEGRNETLLATLDTKPDRDEEKRPAADGQVAPPDNAMTAR